VKSRPKKPGEKMGKLDGVVSPGLPNGLIRCLTKNGLAIIRPPQKKSRGGPAFFDFAICIEKRLREKFSVFAKHKGAITAPSGRR